MNIEEAVRVFNHVKHNGEFDYTHYEGVVQGGIGEYRYTEFEAVAIAEKYLRESEDVTL